jgi:hypothetical protein
MEVTYFESAMRRQNDSDTSNWIKLTRIENTLARRWQQNTTARGAAMR